MKVYSCPDEVPAPQVDYANYDLDRTLAAEASHRAALAEHFRKQGYIGRRTGKTLSMPVGDGYAQYMLIEGRLSFLIHLPYGDGYQYPDVRFLPKDEVVRRITAGEQMEALFASKAVPAAPHAP